MQYFYNGAPEFCLKPFISWVYYELGAVEYDCMECGRVQETARRGTARSVVTVLFTK